MAQKVSKNNNADTSVVDENGGTSALVAGQVEISLRGETFTVKEWTMGEIGEITERFSALIGIFLNLSPAEFENQMLVMAILMRQAELTNGLLAYSLGKDSSWVKAAKLGEGATAAVKLIMLNLDFFRAILEMLKGMGNPTGNPAA